MGRRIKLLRTREVRVAATSAQGEGEAGEAGSVGAAGTVGLPRGHGRPLGLATGWLRAVWTLGVSAEDAPSRQRVSLGMSLLENRSAVCR